MRFQERREDNKQNGPFLTRVQENNKMYKERFRDHISPYCGTPETGDHGAKIKDLSFRQMKKKIFIQKMVNLSNSLLNSAATENIKMEMNTFLHNKGLGDKGLMQRSGAEVK